MDIQLSKYVACICEGSAEQAIIDLLLEHNSVSWGMCVQEYKEMMEEWNFQH